MSTDRSPSLGGQNQQGNAPRLSGVAAVRYILEARSGRLSRQSLRWLASLDALPTLIEATHSDDRNIRRRAIFALIYIGGEAANQALADAYPRAEGDQRGMIIHALTRTLTGGPLLCGLLRWHSTVPYDFMSVGALLNAVIKHADDALETLLYCYEHGESYAFRMDAAGALTAFDDERIMEPLAAFALCDWGEPLRRMAAIGYMRRHPEHPIVKKALRRITGRHPLTDVTMFASAQPVWSMEEDNDERGSIAELGQPTQRRPAVNRGGSAAASAGGA